VAVALAWAALRLPRAGTVALALVVVALSVAGLWASYGQRGQYHDFRAVVSDVNAHLRPGDGLWAADGPLPWEALVYHEYVRTRSRPLQVGYTQAGLVAALRAGHRVWVVSAPRTRVQLTQVAPEQQPVVAYERRFVRNGTLQLTLLVPRRDASG
jgi:hypothetical protein